MRVFWRLLISMLILVCVSGVALAERSIEEIQITGQKRTAEQVVLKLLPFKEGENWVESDKDLILKRLEDLGIFYPGSYTVTIESVSENSIKVIVGVKDPNVFYPDIVSYLLEKAFKIVAFQTLDQVVYNPWGNGMNLFAGYCFGKNTYLNLGISGQITNGWNYTANYFNFKTGVDFTDNQKFLAKGHDMIVEVKNYLTANWKQSFGLGYYLADVDINNSDGKQEYLIFKTRSKISGLDKLSNELNLNGMCIFPLNDQSVSWKVNMDYTKEKELFTSNKILVSVKGGISSKNTPLNLQYNGGGFTQLPLRGTKPFVRGFNYAIANVEFHQMLGYGFRLVGFADIGNFWDDQKWNEITFEKNIGMGLAYDSPLGVPLRVDFAKSLIDGEYAWNFGLDLLFKSLP